MVAYCAKNGACMVAWFPFRECQTPQQVSSITRFHGIPRNCTSTKYMDAHITDTICLSVESETNETLGETKTKARVQLLVFTKALLLNTLDKTELVPVRGVLTTSAGPVCE